MTVGAESLTIDEASITFNMVWTGDSFDRLRVFVDSILSHTTARFRFVANACPPAQVASLEAYAEAIDGRVVEVHVVSDRVMIPHGAALEAVWQRGHDDSVFAFMDPDIFVTGPFMAPFLELLAANDAVTSGSELWSTSNVLPEGHRGVNGEYFYREDGLLFGSPHFALYRRSALEDVRERWGVDFTTGTIDGLNEQGRAQILAMGCEYLAYDTFKLVNLLLQAGGGSLVHQENDRLRHIGGLLHFLVPPVGERTPSGGANPAWFETADWGEWEGQAERYAVAAHTARALALLHRGEPPPPVPRDLSPVLQRRLAVLGDELKEMVERWRAKTSVSGRIAAGAEHPSDKIDPPRDMPDLRSV